VAPTSSIPTSTGPGGALAFTGAGVGTILIALTGGFLILLAVLMLALGIFGAHRWHREVNEVAARVGAD
jgi:hypothetical protein